MVFTHYTLALSNCIVGCGFDGWRIRNLWLLCFADCQHFSHPYCSDQCNIFVKFCY